MAPLRLLNGANLRAKIHMQTPRHIWMLLSPQSKRLQDAAINATRHQKGRGPNSPPIFPIRFVFLPLGAC